MPNIKSSAKRDALSKERNAKNRAARTQLRTNLKKFDAAGFSGYLSLEPHLFHFAGFDSLEKGPAAEKKESNGVRAYKAAHAALLQILN